MQTLIITVKGNVQGVFYRAFAKITKEHFFWDAENSFLFSSTNAEKLGITGYAKNLDNGDVEILAQGKENILKEFVKILKSGPLGSEVVGMNYKEIYAEKAYKGFSIAY